MQALAQPSKLGVKAPVQGKVIPVRSGKPLLSTSRGGLQPLNATSLTTPLYQLGDLELAASQPVVDPPTSVAVDSAVATSEALAAGGATPEVEPAAIPVLEAVGAVAEKVTGAVGAAAAAVTDAAEAAASALSDAADVAVSAVTDAADVAVSVVTDAADVAVSTVTDAAESAGDVVSATVSAVTTAPPPLPAAPSLAAQRYAEMTSKAAKVAPSGSPAFEPPSFSLPDLSGIQLPKLSAPDFSKMSPPDLSKLSVPEMPKLPSADGAEGGLPAVSLPAFQLPKLDLDLDVPDVGGAASGLTAGASSAVGAVAADVTAAASKAAASVSAAAAGVSNAVSGALSEAATAVNGATGGLLDELDRELAGVRGAVQSATTAVSATVGGTVSSVESAIGGAVGQVYDALPPQAQVVAKDLGDVVYAFASHPTSSLVLAGLVGVPLGVKSYVDRYGGYSGDLDPAVVKEMLAREDALVVDVRSEWERQASGILQLRKGARFSAAAVPADLVTFSPKLARESKTGERLPLLTAALLISRLTRIRTPLTKIVIMNDQDDVAARELARAVRSAGVLQVYVMTGGFQAWSAAELGVETTKTDYETSMLAVLLDEVAEVAAVVGPKLRQPAFLSATLATTSLVAYAAVNYHTTLRYFAVWGIFATIYWRLSRYESPQAFLEDVKGGVVTAASFTAAAASAAAGAAVSAATSAAASKPPSLPAPSSPTPAFALPAPTPAARTPAAAPKTAALDPFEPLMEASSTALEAALAAAGITPAPVDAVVEAPSTPEEVVEPSPPLADVPAMEQPTAVPESPAAATAVPESPAAATAVPESPAAATAASKSSTTDLATPATSASHEAPAAPVRETKTSAPVAAAAAAPPAASLFAGAGASSYYSPPATQYTNGNGGNGYSNGKAADVSEEVKETVSVTMSGTAASDSDDDE